MDRGQSPESAEAALAGLSTEAGLGADTGLGALTGLGADAGVGTLGAEAGVGAEAADMTEAAEATVTVVTELPAVRLDGLTDGEGLTVGVEDERSDERSVDDGVEDTDEVEDGTTVGSGVPGSAGLNGPTPTAAVAPRLRAPRAPPTMRTLRGFMVLSLGDAGRRVPGG